MSAAWGGDKALGFPERVLSLLEGDLSPYPVTAHVGLVAGCNQDCVWCSDIDYRKKYPGVLDESIIRTLLVDLAEGGTKSIVWTGSGESTLHPRFAMLAELAAKSGLQQGLITNGSRLEVVDPALFSWVRVSLDAGTAATHRRLHQSDDFDQIMAGMAEFKRRPGDGVLGVSYLVNRDNAHELAPLVKQLDVMGVDYIRARVKMINPAGKHYLPMADELCDVPSRDIPTDNIQVTFDAQREGGNAGLPCWASSLNTVVAPTGDVFMCCRLSNTGRDEEVGLGQLTAKSGSFHGIWQSEKRRETVMRFRDASQTAACPVCWLTRMNVSIDRFRTSRVEKAGVLFI